MVLCSSYCCGTTYPKYGGINNGLSIDYAPGFWGSGIWIRYSRKSPYWLQDSGTLAGQSSSWGAKNIWGPLHSYLAGTRGWAQLGQPTRHLPAALLGSHDFSRCGSFQKGTSPEGEFSVRTRGKLLWSSFGGKRSRFYHTLLVEAVANLPLFKGRDMNSVSLTSVIQFSSDTEYPE